MNKNEDCRESLISLKACGICNRCLKNIDEIKEILRFYDLVSKPENTSVYAKIYHTDIGQILVKIDQGESLDNDKTGSEVRFYLKPEGLGVCSTAIKFNDSDGGDKAAQHLFDTVTEDMALKAVQDIVLMADNMAAGHAPDDS